jgi:hypothetical protein
MEINEIASLIALLITALAGGFLLGVPTMKSYYQQKLDLESSSAEEKASLGAKILRLKAKLKRKKRK